MSLKTSSAFPQRRRPPRLLTGIISIIGILAVALPLIVGLYTNWLWFGEVQFRGVFNKVILVRVSIFLAFSIIGAAIIWLAGYLTYRTRPDMSVLSALAGKSPIVEYRKVLDKSIRRLLPVVAVVGGVAAGVIAQQKWQVFQLFFHRQTFGKTDPQFGMDYGFYAFDLPFIRTVLSALITYIGIAFAITLVGHYLLGNIQVANQLISTKTKVAKAARIQLGVWAGLWMLAHVAGYWFDRYDLLNKTHETFTGGSYTDINAILPAKIILMVISLVVALSFFSVIVLKDLRIPAVATVLMLVSGVVIGTAYPLVVERFSVSPNRAEKEAEYIARNIDATRYAFGITDDKVTYKDNWGTSTTQAAESQQRTEEVSQDNATINNIRLLDPEVISPTFTQQQQLKNFYGFPASLSMDRYEIDGQLRDFVVAAREINPNSLQENQRDWINRHTVYTHGNGFVAAQANQVDEVARDVGSARGGYPVYTVSDLQATDKEAEEVGIKVTEPRIYYGPVISSAQDGADYAIVGSDDGKSVEYDSDSSTYTYSGKGGVKIGNIFNRAAYAIQYQEMNLILSDRVNAQSKILYDRDPRERVHKVAPWLTTDSTTYPAVIDGKIKWIVDGYTTLSSLPYAQRTNLTDATQDTSSDIGVGGQRPVIDNVGYIRNSVKAVVDAYDGSVELYAFDEQDPVLKAWRGVFPDTVKPKSEISEELMNHIRYPEDFFKVQREMLSRYHVDDAREFFTNDRFWSVPGDPTAEESQRSVNQPPYYVVAADPDTAKPSFQLITAFRGLNREFLAAHMSASSDPDNYGKITVRVLPTDTQTQGPKQVQDTMTSSDQYSANLTLWRGSNDIITGNLLTLPVGSNEILYVEPIYSKRKDQASAFPKLLRVLVSYRGQVGYAPTISEALAQVGIDPKAAQDLDEAESITPASPADSAAAGDAAHAERPAAPSLPASGTGTEGEAIERINNALSNLEKARSGSHEEYGKALDALDAAVESYQSIVKAGNAGGAGAASAAQSSGASADAHATDQNKK
ncbi:UPF0182 family protein [Corynebacterium sp. sy017]|uniref:UPF0182 family protein n=1 Tax=Corynebacterium sp. SY003 TaxID=2499164 RepID=UPI0011863C15|nr:UPF0182 family protein [Corynebacterium sp. sy017]TSD92045.1 UPF0182 family protein [Corynebacterium sp. SY003]